MFIDLPVQYMKTTSSEHVMYINFSECQNKNKQLVYTTCFELVAFMYWTCNSINNMLSYGGLVDAKIRASDKDLPVPKLFWSTVRTNCSNHREKLLKFELKAENL